MICVDEIGLGVRSTICALLHDTVEDTDITLDDVKSEFGNEIAKIVDGLTKISTVMDTNSSQQAENFKKILLTLTDDPRVILIKLADRLHNMRTLDSMKQEKQLKIASETIWVYAPLAHRMGLYNIKTELEDLSMKYLEADTYKEIAKKFKLATNLGLVPILCVGETLAQRQAEQTQAVLQGQLESVFDFGAAVLEQGIIAYEPVWAIGTGLSAQPEQAQEVHQFLRHQAKLLDPDLAQKLPILYGGSVKASNAKPLFQMPDIDGGLIGGASLDAVEFLDIYGILASITAGVV
jgi:hypothetical protein